MSFAEYARGKYVLVEPGKYKCRDCSEIIMGVNRYDFQRDRYGFMEHETSLVSQEPFCPMCELDFPGNPHDTRNGPCKCGAFHGTLLSKTEKT